LIHKLAASASSATADTGLPKENLQE